MIGNPRDKRQAQRLTDLLDESDDLPRRHGRTDHDQELTQLAHVGRALRQAAPSVAAASAPDSDFQAALRRRLMATAAAEGIGATARTSTPSTVVPRQRTRRRFALAAVVLGMVLGLSGVATASGDAVPGDALYPVKRTTERAQLALAGSDVNRGQLYLEFARTRLAEADGLLEEPVAMTTALADMDSDTIEGINALTTAAVEREDAAVLDAIDEFVSQQRPGVVTLVDMVGGDAGIRAAEAVSLLDEVAQRSHELRNSLPCGVEDTDRLGPVPAQCSAQPGPEGDVVEPESSDNPSWESGTPDGQTPGEDEASATESPSPSDEPSPSSTDDETEEDEDDGGGLLSELGDLLSGLLGGWVAR